MVPVALGTQTAGSVVRPATFCGVAGYAATHGELPMRGVQPLAPGLDTLGVFAREVADLALVRAALLGVAVARPAAPAAPRLVLWEAPELEPRCAPRWRARPQRWSTPAPRSSGRISGRSWRS